MHDPSSERDPVEVLAAEFMERCRRGERPSLEEYVQRHPELASEIRELFPTIAAIERLKTTDTRDGHSGPVRGDVHLERLGDFRIVRELGRGGMGIVYEAQQESLGRRVAVKVLPRQLLLEARQLDRFEREARTAAKLHHTNIVPIFGVGEHEGYHYIAMQYIHGVGLDVVFRQLQRALHGCGDGPAPASSGVATASRRKELDVVSVARTLIDASSGVKGLSDHPVGGALTATAPPGQAAAASPPPAVPAAPGAEDAAPPAAPPAALRLGSGYWSSIAHIALQAADALAYAHEQHTLHRDVKPGNLLLDADGTVWVADFGLAKAVDQDGVTRPGDVVGTLRYMAPELFRGDADARSDVYSLGVTVYELATLQPAFADSHRTSLIDAIMQNRLTAPRLLAPGVPRDLETIILKCIAREPEARYPSAAALAEDLRRFLEDRPILARRAGLAERGWRWSRRNPMLASLLGATAVLLAAVSVISTTAYFQTRRANTRTQEALAGETAQRERAENTTDLALEALDTIFDELAPRRAVLVASKFTDDAESEDETDVVVPIEPVLSRETAGLLEHMLDFYRRLATQQGNDPGLRRKIAEANRRVGDIHQRLGQLVEAQAAYERALEHYHQVRNAAREASGPDLEVARIHNELGTVLLAKEAPPAAMDAFREALSILKPIAGARDATSGEATYELARTLFLLARTLRPRLGPVLDGAGPPGGRPGEQRAPGPPRRPGGPPGRPGGPGEVRALGHLHRAITLLSTLAEAHPSVPEYRRLLAVCYCELPDPPPGPGGQDDGAKSRVRGVELLEKLVRDFPDVPQYKFDLAEAYALPTARAPGLTPDGLAGVAQQLDRARQLGEELVSAHPNVPAYAHALAHTYHKLAEAHERLGGPEMAGASLDRAIDLQKALVNDFPEVMPYRASAALFQNSLARLLVGQNRLEEARRILATTLAMLEEAASDRPRPRYLDDLARRCRRKLAELRRRADDGQPVRPRPERRNQPPPA